MTRLAQPPAGFGRRALTAHRDHASADEVDFFPSPPYAFRAVAELILELDPAARSAWEIACGAGHGVHGLKDYFPIVHASDAYPYNGNFIWDFLSDDEPPCEADWIVTNPPFNNVADFIRLAYARASRGVAMLMRAAVLESQGRHALLTREAPLSVFAPFSERVPMHRGRWEPDGTSAAFYAWFIWVKPPVRKPAAEPVVRWIAPGTRSRLARPDDARLFGAAPRALPAAGSLLDVRA